MTAVPARIASRRAWRTRLGAAALVVVAGCSAVSPRDDADAALLRTNLEYDAALVAGDAGALERLYAEDFVYLGPGAVVRDKRAQIAAFADGTIDLLEGRSDDVAVRRYGDTAVMTGRFTGRVLDRGREYAFKERYSAVWVLDDGRWRLVLEHGTVVPDP